MTSHTITSNSSHDQQQYCGRSTYAYQDVPVFPHNLESSTFIYNQNKNHCISPLSKRLYYPNDTNRRCSGRESKTVISEPLHSLKAVFPEHTHESYMSRYDDSHKELFQPHHSDSRTTSIFSARELNVPPRRRQHPPRSAYNIDDTNFVFDNSSNIPFTSFDISPPSSNSYKFPKETYTQEKINNFRQVTFA